MRAPLAALLAVLAAVGAARAGEPELADYVGAWVRVEPTRDDAERDAEIVRATGSMGFGIRAIARAVMRFQMQPPGRYVIDATSLRAGDGPSQPIDGATHAPTASESVTTRFEGGAIRQTWRHGDDNRGDTTWHLEDDGHRLRVTIRVEDSRLDGAMVYATRYRRAARPRPHPRPPPRDARPDRG